MTIDENTREKFAAKHLDYRELLVADTAAIDAHQRAVFRGFIDSDPNNEALSDNRQLQIERGQRTIGVYDSESPALDTPIATIGSWQVPMSVPGGFVNLWAISILTVAPTHHRRGIARTMVEGELRDAANAGAAIAGLTVSEATIYSRYGFGPASWKTDLTVDSRRAGWSTPNPSGSYHFVPNEVLAEHLEDIYKSIHPQNIGSIGIARQTIKKIAGVGKNHNHNGTARGIIYVDEHGHVTGALPYRIETHDEWARSELIGSIWAKDAQAHAALWQYALHHDLVGKVKIEGCAVDDSIFWLVKDRRAIKSSPQDDHWLRILDTKRALEARTYGAAVKFTLQVRDELGFAGGSWQFRTEPSGQSQFECAATLTETADADATQHDDTIELDIAELSSLYLGGVSVWELHRAGRINGSREALHALELAFRTSPAPLLRIEY